jgi:hypothetical protein
MKEMRDHRFAGCSKILMVLVVTGLVWITPVTAQDTKLQQGISNFMDGSYYKAMEYLNQAISLDKTMTPEMLTEAYYYRGLTYVRLYNEAFAGKNPEDQKTYKDALLLAYKDFKSSLEHDNGKYWQMIDLEIKNLHHSLLQEGLASLNSYNDGVYNKKTDPKLLARAEEYLLAAHEIRESYLVCDLLGQVYLDKGQKQLAVDYFTKSEKLYTDKPPEEPDFLMAYVFYRLAAIHKPDDITLALQDDQRGLRFLETEYERYTAIKSKLSPQRIKQMEDQYSLALQDLTNLKLDLYMTDSNQYVEALHIFEEELSKTPDDVNVLIGYASLLEKSDREKAILTYKKVIVIDTANSIALYNLGALYYEKGKTMLETAKNTKDNQQYTILTDDAMDSFRTAKPYFERAFAVEPESLEIIQALKTIAFILEDEADYQKYKDLETRYSK